MRRLVWFSPVETISSSYENSMYGRLLAAELRHRPWPEDWHDPSRAPLHALVRDGRIVGAYSLGADGVDHAGSKPNVYFPLLERLTPPKPVR